MLVIRFVLWHAHATGLGSDFFLDVVQRGRPDARALGSADMGDGVGRSASSQIDGLFQHTAGVSTAVAVVGHDAQSELRARLAVGPSFRRGMSWMRVCAICGAVCFVACCLQLMPWYELRGCV